MNLKEYNNLDRRLTKEERKELFNEYHKTREQEIRDILIEEHLYIAEILSKKYTGRGIDYDDIYQVASIGLIYAIERYDPEKGFEFSSFATPTIIGEIKKYFRDNGWTIRVPRRIHELSKKNLQCNCESFTKVPKDSNYRRDCRILGFNSRGSYGGHGSI